MKLRKSLLALTLILSSKALFAYNVVDRYILLDDKLKTDQMLRPFGHDFIIDLNAAINKDLPNTISDISDVSKQNDTNKALATLNKYSNTEQAVKLNLTLGIPIFSFSIGQAKISPNIRANIDFGSNIGIRTQALTTADIIAMFPSDIPEDLKTFIGTLTAGQDIIAQCTASGTLSTNTKAFCATQKTGVYIIPSVGAPTLAFYAKLDGKAGLFNDYTYGEHFFGNLNLYALSRTDLSQILSSTQIAAGAKIELPSKKNTEMTVQADYRLGYKNDNYRVSLSAEELKLAKPKARETGSRELSYGYNALLRLHGEADYRFSAFSLMPFAGFHKRSGYGFADGVYAGAIAGAHVWGDRLGLMLKGEIDKQYFTIAPRIKVWLMQIEYSLKAPMKSMDGDVKLSAIQSVNLRLFF